MYPMNVFPIRTAQRQLQSSTRPNPTETRDLTLFEQIVDHAPDLVYIADKNGRFSFVNERSTEITGYSRKELIGMSHLNLVDPAYRAKVRRFYLRQFLTGESLTYLEFPMITKSGKRLWMGQNVSFQYVYRLPAFVVIARDITEKKHWEEALRESEQKYRDLFDNAVQGMFQVSITGQLINANPALLRLLGYDSLEELKYVDIATKHYVNSYDRQRLTELLLTHGFCRDVELNLRKKDDSLITVLEHSRVIRDAEGKPVMFEGILEDISVRKQQDRKLRESVDALRSSEEALAELNARKDKLLFALSHDLRSPLGSILGFTELLLDEKEKPGEEESRQFLAYIRDAAQSQLKSINELLSRPVDDTNNNQSRSENVDLSDVAKKSVELLLPAAKQKSVDLQVDLPQGTIIYADVQMAMQVFNNLISNALKFTQVGGSVSIGIRGQTERDWIIAVRDTGIGIPSDDLQRLFVSKGAYSRTGIRGEVGTGVGLPLCAEIMNELNGEVTVESTEGCGTTFVLRFPKADQKQRLTVLLVDDEPGIRALHARYIKRAMPDVHVVQASDGQKALELMVQFHPTVVFSDYAMPNMNGLALLGAIRQREELKDIPVVIATGHDSWAVREDLNAAGAFAILAKPVSAAQIKEVLGKTVRNIRSENGTTI
jgi:PAS domain S-box-containing protein